MRLKFWRHRYALELPFSGGMRASFTAGKDGIEDLEIDDKTGVVKITQADYVVVIHGEGFGWSPREKKPVKVA